MGIGSPLADRLPVQLISLWRRPVEDLISFLCGLNFQT